MNLYEIRNNIKNIYSSPDGSMVDSPIFLKPNYSGPISGPLWNKIEALNSKYPENFDWAVYDRIHDRYKDNLPRGGVLFKTGLKLVNHHSSCSKCHHSFEIDSYGRGCIHECVFCYAKDQLSAHGYWNRPIPFPLDLSEIRKIFYTVFETEKPSKWRAILEKKIPLRIGSMSDSFMWIDKKYGITKELLRILSFYNYPYVIFTRSDLVAEDSYLEVLRKDLAAIQFSISGDNEYLIKRLEPGAPSIARRFRALKKLNGAGYWATVRVNPLFPTRPDGYYSNRDQVLERFGAEKNVPEFNLISDEFFSKMKDSGVRSFLAGFVRLSPWAIKNISDATNINFRDFFKPEILKALGDKHFSASEIRYYYEDFKKKAIQQDIRFTTCYIGNGLNDYFAHQNLWSNKSDCCDIVGNVPSIQTTSQSVEWKDRLVHARSKESALTAMKIDMSTRSMRSIGSVTNERPLEL